MDPTGIGLFRLVDERLAWLDRRQAVLAQNVANADTPGYQPRDVRPFADTLARTAAGAAPGTMPSTASGLARTSRAHMAPASHAATDLLRSTPHERAPDGNAVSVEQQLVKVADTATAQELATALHRKYAGMFRLALGRNA